MLNTKGIVQNMGDLENEKLMVSVKEYMENYPRKDEALNIMSALHTGLEIVEQRFKNGEYFTGDLIFAGELMIEAINILKSAFEDETFESQGIILLGTVYNDLHDIGKNVFKKMAEAVGFEVIDLGVNVEVEKFVHYAKEIKPKIIGLSGVLAHTIFSMNDTIGSLKAAKVNAKIIIGGNMVDSQTCECIGADAFANNAAIGVSICQGWTQN